MAFIRICAGGAAALLALTMAAAAAQTPGSARAASDDLAAGQAALMGFPADPQRALTHFRRAAVDEQAGTASALAKWYIGMQFKNGLGVRADPAEAYLWFAAASEAGCVPAMVSRAAMLATGEGVAEDDAAARIWYARAAASGQPASAQALRSLAAMLMFAEGGEADTLQGYAYLAIAAEAGDVKAVRLLSGLRPQFDPAARAAAGAIASQWRRENPPPRP